MFNEKLEKFINELQNNEFIKIKECEVKQFDKVVYNAVMNKNKIKIFEELNEFYKNIDSCIISWNVDLNQHSSIKKYSEDDTQINGEICIKSIKEFLTFDKKLAAPWWVKELEKEEAKNLKKFRYFDYNDDYIRVGYILNKNIIEDDLLFINQNSTGFCPTDLVFSQYLDKILYYKGFQGWQYNHFYQMTDNYKRMMFYLNQIFKLNDQ